MLELEQRALSALRPVSREQVERMFPDVLTVSQILRDMCKNSGHTAS